MTAAPDIMDMVRAIVAPSIAYRPVFPSYIAFRVRDAMRRPETKLLSPDRDYPGADIGEIESLGNSAYAIHVTDRNGTKYRITVEVQS